MTLIVGAKCSDGVVLGADGAATLGDPALGQATVIQPVRKLKTLQSRMVMGVSGPIGLGQLYVDRVESLWRDKKLGREVNLPEAQRTIASAIYQDAGPALQRGQQLALTQSVVALPIGGPDGQPELVQCNHVGEAEAATDDLPFVAIGSGQSIADPFFAFLRRVFWRDKPLILADGVFAVVWALTHAIRVNPGGVSEPIEVVVLQHKKAPALLSVDDLDQHRQSVDAAEKHLASFGAWNRPGALTPSPPSP